MSDIDAEVTAEIARRVKALVACGTDWSEADQIRFLRVFVETGLDELERTEDDYFDLLVTCVQLAGENMQDARLGALEADVAELRNPPVLLGDLLAAAAIVLAGELLVVGGAYTLIPAVLAVLAGRAAARSARQILARTAVTDGQLVQRLDILQTKAAENAAAIAALQGKLVVPGSAGQAGELRPELLRLYRIRETMRDDALHVRAALQTNLDTANRAAAAGDGASAPLSVAWQGFLDGVAGQTVVGRVGEEFGPAVTGVIAQVAAAGGSGASTFQTSTAMGTLISEIEQERTAARREWAEQRLLVRFLRDDALLGSAYVQELVRRIHVTRPQLAEFQAFSRLVRAPVVDGVELFLWYSWFRYNQMLGVKAGVGIPPRLTIVVPGQILDGVFVTSVTSAPLRSGDLQYRATGDLYPAIPRLSDDLAEYLYRKYARAFFVRSPRMLPEPLRFDAARYDAVTTMPRTTFGFVNAERASLVDQMRLMVAIYFNHAHEASADALAGPVRDLIKKLLGVDPVADPLRGFFEEQTQPPPVPQQHSPFETAPSMSATEAVQGYLRDAGVERMWLVGEARSRLETAITDLDLRVTTYPLLFGDGTAPPLGAPTADDALDDIEAAKDAVSARHQEFLDLAADRPDLLDAVRAAHGERIAALAVWTPDADEPLAWHFPTTTATTA